MPFFLDMDAISLAPVFLASCARENPSPHADQDDIAPWVQSVILLPFFPSKLPDERASSPDYVDSYSARLGVVWRLIDPFEERRTICDPNSVNSLLAIFIFSPK